MRQAKIHVNETCDELPTLVSVHFTSDDVDWRTLQSSTSGGGQQVVGIVDMQFTYASPDPQTVYLYSSTGIEWIEMKGDEICIHEVCVFCDAPGYPPDEAVGFCVKEEDVILPEGPEELVGLSEVFLGHVRLTEAVSREFGPAGIDLVPVEGDEGEKVFQPFIPWSENAKNIPMIIHVGDAVQGKVRGVTIHVWPPESTVWHAVNPAGEVVDERVIPPNDLFPIGLFTLTGNDLHEVRLKRGREVFISEICIHPEGPNAPESPSFRRADADGNGEADLSDFINILKFLLLGTFEPPCMDAVDVDDSGMADLNDAIVGLRWFLLGATPPPYPGPNHCGQDPSNGSDGIGREVGCF